MQQLIIRPSFGRTPKKNWQDTFFRGKSSHPTSTNQASPPLCFHTIPILHSLDRNNGQQTVNLSSFFHWSISLKNLAINCVWDALKIYLSRYQQILYSRSCICVSFCVHAMSVLLNLDTQITCHFGTQVHFSQCNLFHFKVHRPLRHCFHGSHFPFWPFSLWATFPFILIVTNTKFPLNPIPIWNSNPKVLFCACPAAIYFCFHSVLLSQSNWKDDETPITQHPSNVYTCITYQILHSLSSGSSFIFSHLLSDHCLKEIFLIRTNSLLWKSSFLRGIFLNKSQQGPNEAY